MKPARIRRYLISWFSHVSSIWSVVRFIVAVFTVDVPAHCSIPAPIAQERRSRHLAVFVLDKRHQRPYDSNQTTTTKGGCHHDGTLPLYRGGLRLKIRGPNKPVAAAGPPEALLQPRRRAGGAGGHQRPLRERRDADGGLCPAALGAGPLLGGRRAGRRV